MQKLLFVVFSVGIAFADPMYNSMPNPQPYNVPSLGFQATQTSEFGELVQPAQTGPLYAAHVLMSNWALESTYEPVGTSPGFNHPITMNLYNVGAGNSVGSLFATSTVNALIPWRPENNPACPDGVAWMAPDNHCYHGLATVVDFQFNGETLPDQFIFGIVYNTQSYGPSPIGVDGPYNSLNVGLNTSLPSLGTNPLPDTAYWNTSTAGWYADGGAGGVGTFRQDQNWSGYLVAAEFETPEPSTFCLFGLGMAVAAMVSRKRRQPKS
jgi:hypothetical protein